MSGDTRAAAYFIGPYQAMPSGAGGEASRAAQPLSDSSGANVLFIHQNFPGAVSLHRGDLAKAPGWKVLAIGRDTAPGMPGVQLLRYRPHRRASVETHHYLRSWWAKRRL